MTTPAPPLPLLQMSQLEWKKKSKTYQNESSDSLFFSRIKTLGDFARDLLTYIQNKLLAVCREDIFTDVGMLKHNCVCVWERMCMWELPRPYSEQLSEVRRRGVRRLTQGSICNWEVLVSGSPVINHPGPILFFDSSVQGLTFNTHDPGPGCARDRRLQKHKNWIEWHFSPLQ